MWVGVHWQEKKRKNLWDNSHLITQSPFSSSLQSSQIDAPICRAGQVQRYNVGRGETAQIVCEVEGIPRDIEFVWKFNTSVHEVLDMPSSIVKSNGTRSVIHFKPMTEHVRALRRFLNCKLFWCLYWLFFATISAGLRNAFVLGQQWAWRTERSLRLYNYSGWWVELVVAKFHVKTCIRCNQNSHVNSQVNQIRWQIAPFSTKHQTHFKLHAWKDTMAA